MLKIINKNVKNYIIKMLKIINKNVKNYIIQ